MRTARHGDDVVVNIDVGIGLVGFFAAAFTVITIVCEVTRTDAVGWAVAALVCWLIVAALVRARRRRAAHTRMPSGDGTGGSAAR